LAQNIEPIEDNIAFLKKVSGFSNLMKDIAKANPTFATEIIESLVGSSIYISPTSLPLLPYHQTTIVGIRPDVQLAVRYGNDIVLGPEFFKLNDKYKKYLLIHEALHGLLPDAGGPAHHQKIRRIVNYLYKNEGRLVTLDLETAWGTSGYLKEHKYLWKEDIETSLRCYLANGYYSIYGSTFKFVGLNCVLTAQDLLPIKTLEKRYPGVEALDNFISSSQINIPRVGKLVLQKPKFNKTLNLSQREQCFRNDLELEDLAKAQQKLDQVTLGFKAGHTEEVLADLVANMQGPYATRTLEELRSEIKSYENNLKEARSVGKENKKLCNNFYPSK
jgi:hypothetical protein